jgi:hypothetical protein
MTVLLVMLSSTPEPASQKIRHQLPTLAEKMLAVLPSDVLS